MDKVTKREIEQYIFFFFKVHLTANNKHDDGVWDKRATGKLKRAACWHENTRDLLFWLLTAHLATTGWILE